jgi:hypothetical protein
MTQDPYQPVAIAPLRFMRVPLFQAREPRMRQIKRHGKAWHAIGRKPLFGKPDVRTEADAAARKLRVQLIERRAQA